jgi:hypothetical protein
MKVAVLFAQRTEILLNTAKPRYLQYLTLWLYAGTQGFCRQKGTSPARLSVPCARLNLQISLANRLRVSGGVAWIIATAS